MFDVGDAIELTMETTTGAVVTATATAPSGLSDNPQGVAEAPAGSGLYPYRFTLTDPGMWRVRFAATGAVTAAETFNVYARGDGPAPLATPEQVAAVFRPFTDAERPIVEARLAQASRMLRSRPGWNLDTRIADGQLDPALVADVAVAMVLRVVNKPGALTGVGNLRSESTGPFRRDFYETGDADIDMTITAADIALLAPPPSGGVRKPAGTIRVQAGLAPAPAYPPTYGDNSSVRLW